MNNQNLSKKFAGISLSLTHTAHIRAQLAIITSLEYFSEVGVAWMGNDFSNQFLELEVEATEETELAVWNLEENSPGRSIFVGLGERAEIPVSQFAVFLDKNRKRLGWFYFYLRGSGGNLHVVDANWSSGLRAGWCVSISEDLNVRMRNSQIVSLN